MRGHNNGCESEFIVILGKEKEKVNGEWKNPILRNGIKLIE